MLRFLQVFYALFSGFLIAVAIPNEIFLFGSPFIGLFALIPLYIALSRSKSYTESFFLCGLQALTVHLLSSFWLGNFKDFAVFTLGASAAGTAVIEACFGLLFFFPVSFHTSHAKLKEYAGTAYYTISFRVIWFAGLYTIWEWAKSTGFLAYPWGTLSMTAYRWPLITQIADITGPYGITFLFSFFSAVCGEGLLSIPELTHAVNPESAAREWIQTTTACLLFFFLTVTYGVFQYNKTREPSKILNAVLVQQNLDPWLGSDGEAIAISNRLSEAKINEFKRNGIQPDLVVWSEAVLERPFPNAQAYYSAFPEKEPLVTFIHRMQTPFIIGGSLTINREQHKYSNAAILLNKDGEYAGAYAKLHLVPFAEVIPGADYAWVRAILDKIIGFSTGWTPGTQFVLFEIPLNTNPQEQKTPVKIVTLLKPDKKQEPQTVFVSTPICFDDAFSEVCRGLFLSGSEVFINITNDSWSLTDSAEYQHFVVASYRAIEYRTTLVRSTNAGYSAIIGPNGKVLNDMPLFEQHGLAASIPVYPRIMTVYARFGNWLPLSMIVLAFFIITGLTILREKNNDIRITTYCITALYKRKRTTRRVATGIL
jgi:apolipoprotein N-acyltransferase